MLNKDFILAGKAIFTVKVGPSNLTDVKDHYTFKVKHKPASMFSKEVYFMSMLTGPDNESSYTYMGCLDHLTGYTRLTAKSKYQEESVPVLIIRRVLDRIWKGEGNLIVSAGWDVLHEGKCGRCGALLTHPTSIETGIGPECAKRMGIGRATGTPTREVEYVEMED